MLKRLPDKVKVLKPSGIRKIYDLANKIGYRYNLCLGQPDFDTPEVIKDAVYRAMKNKKNGYTPNAGIPELREALADYYRDFYTLDVKPDQFIITCGACQAISTTVHTLVGPGDEVIIPDPGFVYYEADVILAGAKPVPLKLREENGFLYDINELEDAISKRTKMIILNYPSNPTGAVMDKKYAEELADLLRKHRIFALSDEVYDRIVYTGTGRHVCFHDVYPEGTVVVNSFSKSFAMPGHRIGYLFSPPDIYPYIYRVQQYSVACANAPSQYGALAGLERHREIIDPMVREYRKRRDAAVDRINRIDHLSVRKPEGAFYLFINIKETGMKSWDFCEKLLRESGVVTVPGTAFGSGGEGFIRISYATSLDTVISAIDEMDSFIRRATGG